jgi:hypothetical protein
VTTWLDRLHIFVDRPADWLIAIVSGIRSTEWLIVIFNGLLVYFTYRLVIATRDLRRSTDKLWEAGERQLKVAQGNTEALINAENAYMFVAVTHETASKVVSTFGRWDKSESMFADEVETPSVAYSMKNFGRTPALLKEISNQLIIAPIFPQPASHTIREQMPEDLIVSPGEPSSTLVCSMEETFTVGDAVKFQQRETIFWFYGYFKFDDAFGRERQLDFRFRYARGDGGFRLVYSREFRSPEPEPSAGGDI